MDRREFARLAASALAVSSGPAWARSAGLTDQPQVAVSPAQKLGWLPAMGLGFSGEKQLICAGRFYTPANRDFTALCRRLGPQVLRIGGSHVDHTGWQMNGPGGIEGVISRIDVQSFADYIRSLGWKVVYGVNMAHTPAKDSAEEARYAAEYLGDALLAFEIGNEPDLYVLHKNRARGYNYQAFLQEWIEYAHAIRATVPDAPLCGPGAYGAWKGYGLPFAKDEARNIVLLTQHYYRMSGKKPSATMDALLDGMPHLFEEMAAMVEAARENHIPDGFRMIETNSFVGGGLPGVSDRVVGGLWTVAYALRAAELGVNGLNFQIGPLHSTNSPIAMGKKPVVTAVRPGFYGMVMVADMGQGSMLATTAKNLPAHVYAFCMEPQNGERNVVLVNLTNNRFEQVRIDTATSAVLGRTILLTGASLTSPGCTLGGATIGTRAEGEMRWTPVQGKAGIFSLDLPPATALRLCLPRQA